MSLFHILLLLFFSSAKLCITTDTLTTSHFLQHSNFLTSHNGTYKLGFFTPSNSLNQYLGIWFTKPSVTKVVWVANRDKPITDSSGVLTVSIDGQLQLLNGQNETIWSSQTPNSTDGNFTAVIKDNGNLVLMNGGGENVWESFDHPTDTFLPGMLPSVSKAPSEQNVILRSWKSYADPAEGDFSFGIDTTGFPQVVVWGSNGLPYWRSGPWTGSQFIGIGDDENTLSSGFVLEDNAENGMYQLSFATTDEYLSFNYEIEANGTLIGQHWDDSDKKWTVGWSVPSTECDVYNTCGAFGVCKAGESPSCRCLRGFRPKNQNEWKKGNWSSGCERKTSLQCGVKQDGFWKLTTMKVPDQIEKLSAIGLESCRSQCANNCSCLAYSYHNLIGCMVWSKELIDMQEFSSGGVDLFIRLANSDLDGGKGHKMTEIVASTVIIGTTLVVVCICLFLFKRMIAKRGKKMERLTNLSFGNNVGQEPPLYTFEMLRNATDNFHPSNKLGEGGFGPVYKGTLGNGQEIAVKRLSQVSGQGQEEFMNEVVVISKLQHRNLVRLLGCCVEAEEKMLIYEYMHNKSLDVFLLDDEKRELLSWEKRFNIIEGISRGLLYLHRDSRLRIIHRDLKTSNILLDEELNAKISDFGMARIFGGNQDQASTRRVVGTFGYMSPEYTMGQFSEKSDVYSFGVILLEIVSGRRNITFHRSEHSTLLAYAWKLWNEENMISLIDPIVSESRVQKQVMRCIQVGLLCVQEHAKDRPNMAAVMSMLDSDVEQLPHPKKPPFSEWDVSSDDQQSKTRSSINTCSFSVTLAR